jgi:hypothetical protein
MKGRCRALFFIIMTLEEIVSKAKRDRCTLPGAAVAPLRLT